jgi:5'-nucleotidase
LVKNVDYVFSGINHGFNVGTDVLYSGTVAAAMEAALSGLPAMAVSLGKNREDLYGRAADLALKVLERSEGKKLSGFSQS